MLAFIGAAVGFIIFFAVLVVLMSGAWKKGTFNNWAAGIVIFFVVLLLLGLLIIFS